ncbi:nucleolar and spindle-associated protein 1 isoform X2 [Pelobates fuscus]|uniref:nucleolar and spindle-associated protein 1 isoform X2 n=1 Tax=Pelobates fuscus TaxID=191477 RepID=UPI002FE4A48E
MEGPAVQELDSMRYSELQKLAKTNGLKANLRADKLLRSLKEHFHPETKTVNVSTDSDSSDSAKDMAELNGTDDKEETVPISHVTHRRGRRKRYTSPTLEVNDNTLGPKELQLEVEGLSKMDKEQSDESNSEIQSDSESKKRKRPFVEEASEQTSLETVGNVKDQQTKSDTCAPPGGKIPRYAGRLPKPSSKPSTPNFKRLHEAHFKKMESIDKYMERKKKRLDAVSSSIQEVKMLAKKSNIPVSEKTPNNNSKQLKGRLSLLSPAPRKSNISSAKTPTSQGRSARCSIANKSILLDKTVFKPSVFSSSKMNVRFSMATKDNEHKHSLTKTPARKSSGIVAVTPASESRKSVPLTWKSFPIDTNGPNDEPAKTPFKFTGMEVETPNTNKKSKFDLQASLARPLGYEPHKGKLKPWVAPKENESTVKANLSVLKATYKQPHLRTREDRRLQQQENRKNQRDKTMGNRRGVAVP